MSFVDTFRLSVLSLHDDLQNHRSLIAVCMWENGPRGAYLELESDSVLLVKSAYREVRFVGNAEQQAERAIKEFGWEE